MSAATLCLASRGMGTGAALSPSPATWSPQAWGGLGFEAGDRDAPPPGLQAHAHFIIPRHQGLVLSPRAAENPGRRAGSQAGRGGSCLPPAPTPSPLTCLPPSRLFQNEITHDELCAACKRGTNLQPCGTCPGAYHLSCLDPPLKTAPKGMWVCPKCQQKVREAVSVCG